eukprot:SAG11_NODE_27326_length_334_cov_0.451064_1_plen_95_part_00
MSLYGQSDVTQIRASGSVIGVSGTCNVRLYAVPQGPGLKRLAEDVKAAQVATETGLHASPKIPPTATLCDADYRGNSRVLNHQSYHVQRAPAAG